MPNRSHPSLSGTSHRCRFLLSVVALIAATDVAAEPWPPLPPVRPPVENPTNRDPGPIPFSGRAELGRIVGNERMSGPIENRWI